MTIDLYSLSIYVKNDLKRLLKFAAKKLVIDSTFKSVIIENSHKHIAGFLIENEKFQPEFLCCSFISNADGATYNLILTKLKELYEKLYSGEIFNPKVIIDQDIIIY